MTTFESLNLPKSVLRGVIAAGYTSPTEIQARAIPPATSGRDLIGCAQTGTGKTAAFVLPTLARLSSVDGRNGRSRPVRALAVVPTRELAVQVDESMRTYGKFTGLRSAAIYGGVNIKGQFRELRSGVDLLAATPGRLLDHMDRGSIDLSQVEILILDEADRMFDMGFIRDIRKIVAATPRNRQTLLFSATMPDEVRKLARDILNRPEHIEVGERKNPADTVMQQVCMVRQDEKMKLLVHVLRTEPVENVLVFSRTKRRADRIVKSLGRQGFAATVMHSNRSQNQRQRALEGFRGRRFNIMVATDIAARGIDVDGISHVINYDTPQQAEDYIHRIGRTGRADSAGDAITFVAGEERQLLKGIEHHTGRPIPRKEYSEFAAGREDSGQSAAASATGGSSKSGQGRSRSGSAGRGSGKSAGRSAGNGGGRRSGGARGRSRKNRRR